MMENKNTKLFIGNKSTIRLMLTQNCILNFKETKNCESNHRQKYKRNGICKYYHLKIEFSLKIIRSSTQEL